MHKRNGFIFTFILLISVFIPSAGFSSESGQTSNDYYSHIRLGEHDFGPYWMGGEEDFYFDDSQGRYIFNETVFRKRFFESSLIGENNFGLINFWLDVVPEKGMCPNYFLGKNISYIQYLFRLQVMSYLYEAIREIHLNLYKIRGRSDDCPTSWEKIFSQCRPKSHEMEKFLKRIKIKIKSLNFDKTKYVRLRKEDLSVWFDQFLSSDEMKDVPITRFEFLRWCHGGKNCYEKKVSLEEVKGVLLKSCQEKINEVSLICSEQDLFFGGAKIENLVDLISQSNTMNIIDVGDHGLGCLKRYRKLLSDRESSIGKYNFLFKVINKKMVDEKRRYLQGHLFLPGALKEFDIKGLENFLFATTPTPAPVVTASPQPTVAPTVTATPISTPRPVVIAITPTKTPTPVPTPQIGYFEREARRFVKQDLKKIVLNMDLFQKDFIFDEDTLKKYDIRLTKFITRSALQDMKKMDKIGTIQRPIHLKFLKYMIDRGHHQGIYNLIAVVGKSLYVENDLDPLSSRKAVYISLTNDQSTGYQWTISITKPLDKKIKKIKVIKKKNEKKRKK